MSANNISVRKLLSKKPTSRGHGAFGEGRGIGQGQSLVELVAGITVFAVIIIFFIDAASLAVGASTGSNICREAARAASVGDPGQNAELAQQKAKRVIDGANATTGGVISDFSLDNVQVADVVRPPASQGGIGQATVTVKTTVQVVPPLVLGYAGENRVYKFQSQQSYPVTFVVPASP